MRIEKKNITELIKNYLTEHMEAEFYNRILRELYNKT